MTFDDVLVAYTAGLDTAIVLLRQVEALAGEQRDAWTRNDLSPLAALATRRAALMHDLAAVEARLEPMRDRLVTDLVRTRRSARYAAADARGQEAKALVQRLMAADRSFLIDLETTLVARRREAHDLDTGGATLAAYKRVVAPTVASAGLFDSLG
jgi:hypothetical protein